MNRVFVLIGSLILFSCTENGDESPSDLTTFPQTWELVKMTGQVANVPPTTGSEMTWQEYYTLYEGHTFMKVRIKGDEQSEAVGEWELIVTDDGSYLKLVYPEQNNLIGNCTTDPVETLHFRGNDTLVGSWQHCDGPGLYYEQVAITMK